MATSERSTRERILDASFDLFRRQGMSGTGLKQILAVAGAPFGSLYHHFPGGKDELAAETIRRAGHYYATVVADALGAHPDPVVAVREAFRGAGQTLVETDFADACPVETVALEVASTNEGLRVVTAEVFETWLAGLARWLGAVGVDDGEQRVLTHVILSSLEGAFVLARSMRSTEPLDACGEAMARLVQQALDRPRAPGA